MLPELLVMEKVVILSTLQFVSLVSDGRGAVPGQDEGLHGVWTATRSDFHLKHEAGFNQNVPKRLNVVKNKRGAVTKFLIFSFQELSQGSLVCPS